MDKVKPGLRGKIPHQGNFLRHPDPRPSHVGNLKAGLQPGPELGQALQRALDAKLAGRCAGREEEIAAALEIGGGLP